MSSYESHSEYEQDVDEAWLRSLASSEDGSGSEPEGDDWEDEGINSDAQQASDSEPEEVRIAEYAYEYLSESHHLFVELTPGSNGFYRCKECQQPYKRLQRIISHFVAKHS